MMTLLAALMNIFSLLYLVELMQTHIPVPPQALRTACSAASFCRLQARSRLAGALPLTAARAATAARAQSRLRMNAMPFSASSCS